MLKILMQKFDKTINNSLQNFGKLIKNLLNMKQNLITQHLNKIILLNFKTNYNISKMLLKKL